MQTNARIGLIAALLTAQVPVGIAQGPSGGARDRVAMRTLSTHADRVSGGDVLVEITAPAGSRRLEPIVTLNGRDVTATFRADGPSLVGLVSGLALGKNQLRVETPDGSWASQSLDITNYPVTGPIISGPHLQPFVCQTNEFKLPDGTTLGPPLDSNCSAPTRIQYVYLPAGSSALQPLAATTSLPPDIAMTTTTGGATVPFVVRVETGTMNRGIYQQVVLHDPTRDAPPSPFSPPPAWNRRLIAIHGSGCPGGWYRQGAAQGVNPLDVARLGEGYALFINTLNHPSNSCNPFLAGETTMMNKERFIETFGVPAFTVSMGGSGGAYTSLQVGDAFPGLFDGVMVTATFPDALSIALAGLDAHLMTHYFTATNPAGFNDAQKIAITGYSGVRALVDAANQAQRTDPVPDRADIEGFASARWNDAVPQELRYHPASNRHGARPTVFDAARNVYGSDPETGFALRPFDNVGVQYGLAALNAGVITTTQFLELNERIGGVDHDANYRAARSEGDAGAIKRAYQSGVTLGGGGGLASIPVFDAGRYNDTSGYHYQWFHFAVRERLRRQNGTAGNHLMWRGPVPADQSWAVFIKWVAAVKADASNRPQIEKVTRNRPEDAVDGCWTAAAPNNGAPGTFLRGPQTFGSQPDSPCNEMYPSYSFTRHAAGGPLDANILKCQLKPIDAKDYATPFSPSELQRLKHLFPGGVCDWSKPGVNQVPVVPWASFGPAPENLVHDATAFR